MTGAPSATHIMIIQKCRSEEGLRLKALLLEGEILGIALAQDVPKISKKMPDVVARARVRGLRDTLMEKVAEAKVIIRKRHAEHESARLDSSDPP